MKVAFVGRLSNQGLARQLQSDKVDPDTAAYSLMMRS